MEAIIALDQGTSSTRALAFDLSGHVIAVSQLEISQHYPEDGWVEQNALEIYQKTATVLKKVIKKLQLKDITVLCIGITNQRETTVVWDKKTGMPIYNAIVWQDRRTHEFCDQIKFKADMVQEKTGLKIDPYFSATKIKWILDNCNDARKAATKGQLAFGTIDSYLIWCLTDGRVHKTDVTNASRTMLYNINNFSWDHELLTLFDVPESMLPDVCNSDDLFGEISQHQFGQDIPITGVIGDQQAASIGQLCLKPNDTKVTFGTGAFLMVNTGATKFSTSHLLTTIAYKTKHEFAYALEGSVFNAGTIVAWLRDKLGVLACAAESEKMAASLNNNGGVYFVPAFTGLGAPHWQANAKAMIMGLQLDSSKSHIVRAALESVAYQVNDLLQVLFSDTDIVPVKLKVDGGMAKNHWLMQFLASLTQLEVCQPKMLELTAQGAAMMAGLGTGFVKNLDDYKDWYQHDWQCQPEQFCQKQYLKWKKTVELSKQGLTFSF